MVGGNFLDDNSYRQNNADQIIRFNINTRYRDKKTEGLSYGINANYMNNRGQEFLIWKDADSGIYRPTPSFMQQFENTRMNIDPYIVYHSKSNSRHSLRTRFYGTSNTNNTGQSSKDYLYYGEYQLQKRFKNELTLTTGLTGTYCETPSEIYGHTRHYSTSGGIFAQADKKINLFSLSLGARWETFHMDKDKESSDPVIRTGLSYMLSEVSSLRASFGQGFRYPSIAEKYTQTTVGALKIFPNDTLHPETGWSGEIGFRQGFKVRSWNGFCDISGFWTQYHNMIEFTFGHYYPDSIAGNPTIADYLNYMGFKACNISNAQINGFEITVAGEGNIFGLPSSLLCGYTYTNPIDLDLNRDSLKSSKGHILKYRFYHSVKFDFEITYKKLIIGAGMAYNSFMINIDKAFEDTLRWPNGAPIMQASGKPLMILPGLKEYREKHNKGDMVFDLRIALQTTNKSKISIILKNVFNREYMTRPGDVQAPRNIAVQYSMRF